MSGMAQDVRDALRAIRSNVGSSTLIVAVLALGIGANVAVFSAVDAVLFRALPVREPESLIRLGETGSQGESPRSFRMSLPHAREYREAMNSLSALALFREGVEVQLATTEGRPEVVSAALVSGNYFELLGVSSAIGRHLQMGDDVTEGAHPVAVLSHSFWRRRFGADGGAVGASIRVNRHAFTIVGVAPDGFAGVALDGAPDVFVPLAMAKIVEPLMQTQMDHRSNPFFQVVGRMKPDATLTQVRAELDTVSRRYGAGQPAREGEEASDPDWRRPWANAVLAAFAVSPRGSDLSWLLLGVMALVLLIACTDAMGVLLARTERRQKAIAIRIAVGATPLRIMRGLLAEGLIVSGLAAFIGVGVAWALLPALFAMIPERVPLPLGAATNLLDQRMLALTVLVATVVGLLFSIVPALRAARTPLVSGLKNEGMFFSSARISLRSVLVGLQVALSTVLLVGTGLLLRSLWNAASVDPGFEMRGVIKASLNLPRGGFTPPQSEALFGPLQEALARIPGVSSAALGTTLLLQAQASTRVEVGGGTVGVGYAMVSPAYVSTLGLTLLRGREFTATDGPGQSPVGLVNEAAAARLFPGRDPIGQRIDRFSPRETNIEIVGVVRARGGSPREANGPLLLLPLAQQWNAFPWQPTRLHLVVRTRGDERAVLRAVPRVVASFDPGLAVVGVGSPELETAAAFAQERLLAALLASFGGLALFLAAVGLYGLTAYTTEGRRREFGVRLALGARPWDLAGIVLAQALRVTAVGLIVGLALAGGASHAIAHYLFGVGPLDPITLVTAAGIFGVITVIAACRPALRAAATNPIEALRSE